MSLGIVCTPYGFLGATYFCTTLTLTPYILHAEVAKVIKQVWNQKVTGDDEVFGDALKLLEDDLKLMAQFINHIKLESSPKDFT